MEVTSYPACSHRKLRAYQFAHVLASDLFWLSRRFPSEERLVLTDQVRKTAQTIMLHVAGGWNKRYSGAAFRQHICEAQSACARLGLWLHIAYDCCYLTDEEHEALQNRVKHMQRLLTRFFEQRIVLLA